jgi:crotonobetainyl-CoA:carnitine CoA-transferase CaiB-like acyl-CoA transferase
VLDLSRSLPGSFCSQILGDYGAEIIKIEDRGGDPVRYNLPGLDGESAQFFSINRNKRSLTLDLRKSRGKSVFKRLAEVSDVIIDGFRPGTMDNLGLGYHMLAEINPALIYCSLTAYGNTGPLRDSPAHDINIVGLAGITELTGRKGDPPAMSAVQVSAVGGSLYGAIAILIALLHRERTGFGKFCDVAMLDSAVSLTSYTMAECSVNGEVPVRGDTRLTGRYAYFNIYETSDGKYISVGASEPKYWVNFCQGIGKPEYIEFHKEPNRQEEMVRGIQAAIKDKSQCEWLKIFSDAACVTPVLNFAQVSEHPQIRERNAIIKLKNFRDSGVDLTLPGPVIKFADYSADIHWAFPRRGEHNIQILQGLGYTQAEIHALMEDEVI